MLVVFVLGCAAISASAIPVRIASYNVLNGIDTRSDRGTTNDTDFVAMLASFQRVQPDIVCFQELGSFDQQAWLEAAATLGYPYYVFPTNTGGTFGGGILPGIWSKYPILASDQVKETYVDPAAAEMSRWPLHAVIQIPGALNPFHVFSVHNRPGTTTKSERLRRAFEIYRTVNYITNMTAQYPLDTEYAIMGDWNDTIEGTIGLSQNTNFPLTYYEERLAAGTLGTGFNDGSDIPWNANPNWLMPYRYYPSERLAAAGMGLLAAVHTGGTNTWTHYETNAASCYRLDMILFSDEIMNSAYGAPTGEVYNSEGDANGIGLPKHGSPPPAITTMDASDHRMVFADFNLIDEWGGITPVGILSEVVDHAATTNGNYVEICNTGSSNLNLSGYSLGVYTNGSTNPVAIALGGTLAAGGVHVVATSTNGFLGTWGVAANQQAAIIGMLDGNDTVTLLPPSGSISDIYGLVGSVPGAWGFANGVAVRNKGVSDPLATWSSNEWTITSGTNAATPGMHQALADASAFISAGPALDPFAPKATNLFAITVGITPNLLASNLAVKGVFRIAGGSWIETAMTNSAGTGWQTPMLNVAKNGGDVMQYCVRFSFAGPQGVTTNFSTTNSYTFPVVGSSPVNCKPMFNEVQANGNSTDTNDFIEIIAPAGLDMAGYRIEHYNGATGIQGPIWTFTFPAFTVPDDGLLDKGSNSLGFVVISQISNNVANTDLSMPSPFLQPGPDGLVLYDASSNILDAVVWLAASTNTFDIGVDDPATVSTNVPPGSKNYLHNIGIDTTSDSCPQAPNNVLMATGTWYSTAATPGTLNARQTNGYLIVAPGDLDLDGILDDVDNCPDTYNPTQIDTDGDGFGDACDPDLDGDGDLNGADNCVYIPNPTQSDIDRDGIGDECDPDADGDGIPNEEDPNPYFTGNLDIDFEDSNLKGTLTDYAPIQIAGRWWVLSNALVVATNDTSDRIDGLRVSRLRGNGAMTLQGTLTNGIGDFAFAYARYKTDGGLTLTPQYNAGAGWVTICTGKTANISALTTNSATVNVVGPVNFRITWTASNSRDDANMDNIFLTSFTPAAVADCTLAAPATAAFDGSAHTADFTTAPLGLSYSVAWSPSPPVELGTYDATVTIPDTETVIGGTFVFTHALTIAQGVATCALDASVSTVFNGLAHTNSFTVTTGLSWTVSYSPSTPVEPGSYHATVTVPGDSRYLGGTFVFSNAVVITQAQATCSMVAPVTATYDGASHTNLFTVTTGLFWSVSYSPSTPVDVGTYDATASVIGDSRYIGVTNSFASAVTIQTTNQEARTVGAPYIIDFEAPYLLMGGTYGPHTNTLAAGSPSNWFINNGYRSVTNDLDVETGIYSLRLRYVGATATNGVLQSVAPFPGIHSVAFRYAMYGTDTKGTLSLQTSANGTDWTAATNLVVDGIQTNFASFSNTLALAQGAYLRFQLVDGNPGHRVNLDDIVILPYEPIAASVALSNLAQIYSNGTARIPTATTDPAGLGVDLTYTGSSVAPTNAGTYTVVASVSTPGYAGSATGTLVVARAFDTLSFGNTNQPYDGTARPVTVSTVSGSAVALTYDGSAAAPTNVGTYAVTGIVNTANWTATNTTVLTISAADMAPQFNAIGEQTAYVGAAMSFGVGAVGYPTPTLALQGTTAASGYGFTPGTGVLAYTPPQADVGARTFTFTAGNSVGVATQVVSVVVYDGVPAAPASIWASATNALNFAAAWSAVEGAAGYRLDVATNATFSGGGGAGVRTNLMAFDFATYTGNETQGTSTYAAANMRSPSLITRGTGVTVAAATNRFGAKGWESHADASTAMAAGDYFEWTIQPISGYAMSITNIALRLSRSSTGASNFVLRASFDSYSADLVVSNGTAATAMTVSSNLIWVSGLQNVSGAITFRLIGWGASSTAGTLGFTGTGDDLLIQGALGSGTPSYVSGYSNRTVSGTSEIVSGLTAGETYYFRALAVSPGGTGTYSSVANVTTKAAQTLTFPAISDQMATNAVELSATASSGLSVGFAVVGGPAAISNGTTLYFTGAGMVLIAASQAGNATYGAAPVVTNAFTVAKATAGVTLNSLSQTYNGSARIVTATTVPSGLTVNFTYDGSATAPTEIGSFAVIGTVSDARHQGSASGTLVVSAPSATVTLGSLAQTYDGTPKGATVTTEPAGLTVNLTYGGSATAPTAAGSYAVTGMIDDVNYSGSAVGTLVIAKAAATVLLDDLWATYDGTAKSITTGTEPAGLSVSVTYDGSATLPANPGSYETVGTVMDANYAGTATETFVISKAAATVTLGGLAPTYDGTAKSVTASTTPAGLTVNLTYDGSAAAPTNAGSYAVAGTISDALYQGSASGTLAIAKAEATVTLGGLSPAYDGTPKNATATTAPAGLTVNLTYDGSATAPTVIGSYAVTGTVSDANYAGSAAGTLMISEASADPFEAWLQGRTLDPQDIRYATDADDDGDGMTTWQEYLADTDPAVKGSVLKITGIYSSVDHQLRMAFPQSTGRYYQLEYSTNLFRGTIISNLGWGIPGQVITNAHHTNGAWYWAIRSMLTNPVSP